MPDRRCRLLTSPWRCGRTGEAEFEGFSSPEDPFAPKRTLARTPPSKSDTSLTDIHSSGEKIVLGIPKPSTRDACIQARRSKVAEHRVVSTKRPSQPKRGICWYFSAGAISFILRLVLIQSIILPCLPEHFLRDWGVSSAWIDSEVPKSNHEEQEPILQCKDELELLRAELRRCQEEGCRLPQSGNHSVADMPAGQEAEPEDGAAEPRIVNGWASVVYQTILLAGMRACTNFV
eukprot:TRINITY_DN43488_c0_g1_i1.p1 TRINITY_DN43488_c0_g1~~TRINITY_DN43488_c0_g1_i1.p1  ORF type:complete len:233 (-),score=24.90 TRINITY_DN43488_c0_g1_i1:344-1042(-)